MNISLDEMQFISTIFAEDKVKKALALLNGSDFDAALRTTRLISECDDVSAKLDLAGMQYDALKREIAELKKRVERLEAYAEGLESKLIDLGYNFDEDDDLSESEGGRVASETKTGD